MTLTETRPLADPTRVGPSREVPSRPRGELASAALLAAGLLAAYAGLHVLLQDASWYLAGAGVLLLVLVTANVARRLVRPAWLPTVLAAVAALLALTIGYAADRALFGVIPTPDVIARFRDLADQAWLSIAEQAIPAVPDPGIVFLLAVLTSASALFGDIVVRRSPALTVIPMLALLAVPVAVHPGIADPVWYAITAIVYLALLRRGQWRSSGPAVLVTGAVVVAGSLLLPFALPPVQEAGDGPGVGVDSAVNPLVNLGDDLRRGSAVTAVTYTTSTGQAVYLRLATLDEFDGREWAPTDTAPPSGNTVTRFPAPDGLAAAVDRAPITAQVQVGAIASRWLPVPYPTSTITGLHGDWRWVQGGLSVHSQATNAGGQSFEAAFVDVQPNLKQLETANLGDVQRVGDLGLPSRMPPIIAETAKRVTAGATSEYDQALALQNYFQSTGGFTYSETAPVKQGYDGSGTQIIAKFLQVKAGYCVHFASAMAVMARTLGIPSRVVVGFQPGTPSSSTPTGNAVYTVSSHDLHAWPELYFSGIGWLRFEPTPGRGVLPIYSQPSAVDNSISQDATGAATKSVPSGPASGGRRVADPTLAASGTSATGGHVEGEGIGPGPWIALGAALVVVAALLIPAASRVGLRLRRRRAIARGRDPAGAAWAEVRDTARDHGWSTPETETARVFAERLAVVLVSEGAAIRGFAARVETSAYAREPRPISLDELRAMCRAIASTSSGRDRVRAALLPPSLVARIRGPRDAEG